MDFTLAYRHTGTDIDPFVCTPRMHLIKLSRSSKRPPIGMGSQEGAVFWQISAPSEKLYKATRDGESEALTNQPLSIAGLNCPQQSAQNGGCRGWRF
jgi:hypothetical protein